MWKQKPWSKGHKLKHLVFQLQVGFFVVYKEKQKLRAMPCQISLAVQVKSIMQYPAPKDMSLLTACTQTPSLAQPDKLKKEKARSGSRNGKFVYTLGLCLFRGDEHS